ncbi:MAG: hypothetical protein CL554_20160 [Algoriphagus sp.]|uniref:hypothetical protein n=1 Tax=Algoriphagus sp. TaxID=1872435 RepID=UPI000C4F3AF2|nr:hypothetical protein [Algoriphagus sp.]MAL15724.1 hypothetical protein [Algoriphagus sp.]
MKEKTTIIMYSHSSYSDVWPLFFKQTDKYLSGYKKVLFCDSDMGKLPEDWDFVSYNNEDDYATRVASCMKNIDTELSFFHHEDMFLYSAPDYELLEKYSNIVLNDDIDFIRLLRSTDDTILNFKNMKTLFFIPSYSQYFFTIQPTLIKTTKLTEIYKNTQIQNFRDFEINVQKTCRDMNIKGLFHYNSEDKVGMHHYNSSVYPYICTAIVKGKWNFSEYRNVILRLLQENNIDYTKRGVA